MSRHCVSAFLLLCCMSACFAVRAQGLKPFWTVEVSKTGYKQGDTVDLAFYAVIPAGLFVYGPATQCDIGPIKPSLKLNLTGAAPVGEMFTDNEKKVQDEIFGCLTGKWEKKAELRQRIVITDDKAFTYSGSLDTQYCDDKKGMCFMQSYTF